MINTLISIIVLAIIFGALFYCADLIPVDAKFIKVVKACLLLIFVVVLLGAVFGWAGFRVVGL